MWYGAEALPPTVDATLYTNLTFWINGGATGGQNITVTGELGRLICSGLPSVSVTAPTNSWKQVHHFSRRARRQQDQPDRYWI